MRDDTTLICDLNDTLLENQSNDLKLKLKKVSDWQACNKLPLNTDKTKWMVQLLLALKILGFLDYYLVLIRNGIVILIIYPARFKKP